jgi:uncharacterized membrane-anchored protein YhcB (DUF1043 family)
MKLIMSLNLALLICANLTAMQKAQEIRERFKNDEQFETYAQKEKKKLDDDLGQLKTEQIDISCDEMKIEFVKIINAEAELLKQMAERYQGKIETLVRESANSSND